MQALILLNSINFLLPLIWLGAILIYWLKYREVKLSWVKYGIFTTALFLIITASYSAIATYNLWKDDPVSQYLLPPRDPAYFYQYVFFHYWRADIINLSVGAIWAGFLWAIYKYSAGRILAKNDVYLGFFAAFIVGWPKIFAYLLLVFGMLLAKTAVNNFVFKDKNPVEIAGNFALAALIIFGLGELFTKTPFLDNLKL